MISSAFFSNFSSCCLNAIHSMKIVQTFVLESKAPVLFRSFSYYLLDRSVRQFASLVVLSISSGFSVPFAVVFISDLVFCSGLILFCSDLLSTVLGFSSSNENSSALRRWKGFYFKFCIHNFWVVHFQIWFYRDWFHVINLYSKKKSSKKSQRSSRSRTRTWSNSAISCWNL